MEVGVAVQVRPLLIVFSDYPGNPAVMGARIWIALSIAWGGAALAAAGEFPYAAVVECEEAVVRSGPGGEYYGTDVLSRGAEVEVHRRDGDEWLGIRPPEGSFSWVPAADLQVDDDSDVALVAHKGAIAWIGARVGRVEQHKWQVRLEPGESVQILSGRRFLASMPSGGEAWYKIAAPAGEFRWIHARDVKRLAALPAAGSIETPPIAAAQKGATQIKLSRMDADQSIARGTDSDVISAGHQETADGRDGEGRDENQPASDGFVARNGNRGDLSQSTATTSTTTSAATPGDDASRIDDELSALELELSSIVVQERTAWDLTDLIDRAELLVGRGESALDRGRARLLLDKLQQFEAIRQGIVSAQSAQMVETPVSADALFVPPQQDIQPSGSNAIAAGSADGPDVAADAGRSRFKQLAEQGRYDGAGWLLPVHSQLPIAPRFALTDDQGRVIQYVIPAPGRNLHRHLRKQVGIIGHRQAAAELGAPVLTASNVIELDRHR